MSEHEGDSLMDHLFNRQGMTLRNIKFCRGSGDVISGEDLRAESHSALLQERTRASIGTTEAPRSRQPLVDLEELFS